MSVVSWLVLTVLVLAVVVVLAACWYKRATNEVSILRTGIGGRRVVIDGGVIAIPYFHEISTVNMQTLRLDVARRGEESLITQDRLRVDVGAEFYVSVVPEAEAITRAAQTLGKRTFMREELRALIEGMLVDALRSVAAKLTMDELHENRAKFVAEVREGLSETLIRYGLQLDSVSLTGLDQTAFSSLDENNAFNAVGMRKLAEVIAKSKKERAEIDADSEVSVRRASMEASRQRLEIDLEERKAEIAQQQEIETLAAIQLAEIARQKASSEKESMEARIEMERAIQEAEVLREQKLSLAEQERQIAVYLKSREESLAQAEADQARSKAVIASEDLATAKAIAEAKRRAEISKIDVETKAAQSASREAILSLGEIEAAKNRAIAKKEEVDAQKYAELASTEIALANIKAENVRDTKIIDFELNKARLEAMPKIVSEMVKPAEKINSINVNHLTGLGNRSADNSDRGPVGNTMDSIMDMAIQLPLLKKIGDQLGVSFDEAIDQKPENDD
jgi:uncharacterized membrane protein YqiK